MASNRYKKRTVNGDADVPDTETPDNGVAKLSIDHFKMLSSEEDNYPYSIVMVNHEDGGIFAYATPAEGIPGDSCWVPRRPAEDVDNCGPQLVTIQVVSGRRSQLS